MDDMGCLLYTSDAADERSSVDLGGRRIIKKKKYRQKWENTAIRITQKQRASKEGTSGKRINRRQILNR